MKKFKLPIFAVSLALAMQSAFCYEYCNNDPINNVDPLGLVTIAIPGVGPQRDKGGNSSNEAFIRGVQSRHSDTQVFSRDQQDQAIEAIKQALKKDPCEKVNVYGYSRGGVAALELAQKLKDAGVNVDLLFTLDPVKIGGTMPSVPSNVLNSQNHYQAGEKMGLTDFPGTSIPSANLDKFYPDGKINNIPVRHENMPAIVLPVK